MISTPVNSFELVSPSHNVRPGTSMGATITPAQNAYGSYATVMSGAAVTEDAFGILINVNTIAVSGASKASLTKIGRDTAGGSSFADWIPGLLTGPATEFRRGDGGVWYYFPLFIKAGTSIGAAGAVNNATVGTQSVQCWLFQRPRHPELLKTGSFVDGYGVTLASSGGVSVTMGTTSEGAWADLGTTTADYWGWEFGMCIGNTAMNNSTQFIDLGAGDATNKKLLSEDIALITTNSEQMSKRAAFRAGYTKSGDHIYGRCQSSAAAMTGATMAAYGVR